jgi:hypothetical protein
LTFDPLRRTTDEGVPESEERGREGGEVVSDPAGFRATKQGILFELWALRAICEPKAAATA